MAIRAQGTTLKFTPKDKTQVTVGMLRSVGEMAPDSEEIDVTTLDSTGGYREYVQGLRDAGEVELTGFHGSDAGQKALREAYASGELKHGTISLIEPGTLVVALGTYEPLFDKAMSNVVEVKARGAEVLALATEPFKEKMAHTADSVIAVPETHPVVQPSLGVVPLQLFAYYVALQRGCDIDKPRNLAKSVTVE